MHEFKYIFPKKSRSIETRHFVAAKEFLTGRYGYSNRVSMLSLFASHTVDRHVDYQVGQRLRLCQYHEESFGKPLPDRTEIKNNGKTSF